jgi:3-oxo-5-alpha-steroid 4-dehydrogenase 1
LVFQSFPEHWWRHPAFVGGLTLAFTGMTINAQTDAALRRLRHRQTTASKRSYSIPVGYWLFDYVSCPHYLGEILQWIGFAIASGGSVVAWSFVAFTAANLIPRAVQQHAWYQQQFASSYPVQRRAWLPFLW